MPWSGQDAVWWPGMPSTAPAAAANKEVPDASETYQGPSTSPEEAATAAGAAATAESVLDALAQPAALVPAGQALGLPSKAAGKRSLWLVADSRPAAQTPEGLMGPEKLLGHWVDSQGNAVHVLSTDAYDVRLVATLSRPPRPDIHLAVKPVVLGGGWQCGHSLLDPVWTTDQQLHWVAMDGRVSVWVRPQESRAEDDAAGADADGGAEAEGADAEDTGAGSGKGADAEDTGAGGDKEAERGGAAAAAAAGAEEAQAKGT